MLGGALVWGSGSALPLPGSLELDAVEQWYAERSPAAASMAGLRVIAGLLVAWVGVGVVVQLLACWVTSLRAVADLVAPPVLRGVASGAASLSLGLAVVPGAIAGEEPGTAVLRPLDQEDGEVASPTTTTAEELGAVPAPPTAPTTGTPTTTPTEVTTTAPVPSTTEAPPSRLDPNPPAPPASPVPIEPDETVAPSPSEAYEVRAGDHLWALAAEQVLDHLGRRPTDGEVARYWAVLVAANRDRLVDPSNSDLIYPGQQLVLPPVDG